MSCLHGKEWETSLQGMRRMNVQWGLLGISAALLLAVTVVGCTWGDPADYESSLIVSYDAQCRTWGSHSEPFVHWTPDDAWLVVDEVDVIRRIAADGSGVQTLKNPNPFHTDPSLDPDRTWGFFYGYYADVSPATSRIVYTSCEFPNEGHDERDAAIARGLVLNYELFTVGIDGADTRRLTDSPALEHFPVWSPDGRRIAFLWSPEDPDVYAGWETAPWALYVMNADGTDRRWLTAGVGLFPPVWSPDGKRLAYIADEEASPRALGRVDVVEVDTRRVTQLGTTIAVPAWSPYGKELALAGEDDGGPVVLAVGSDGTGRRTVWASEAGEDGALVTQLAWSPAGTGLVFVTDEIYIIRPGASGALRLIKSMGEATGRVVAWTRDGTRIAVYEPCYRRDDYKRAREYFEKDLCSTIPPLTVRPDGTDFRIIASVLGHEDPGYDSYGPYLTGIEQRVKRQPVDPGVCSGGFVVPKPEANPGLVRDCEVLLRMQVALAGTRPLFWDGNTPIDQWMGVGLEHHELAPMAWKMEGSSPRVRTLNLWGISFNGTLAPELSELTELQSLVIPGWVSLYRGNYLTGAIPPELGELSNLLQLDLSRNHLVGHLPVELRQLHSLAELHLSANILSGPIPPGWATIGIESPLHPSRPIINLRENQLTGGVPEELLDSAQVDIDPS